MSIVLVIHKTIVRRLSLLNYVEYEIKGFGFDCSFLAIHGKVFMKAASADNFFYFQNILVKDDLDFRFVNFPRNIEIL